MDIMVPACDIPINYMAVSEDGDNAIRLDDCIAQALGDDPSNGFDFVPLDVCHCLYEVIDVADDEVLRAIESTRSANAIIAAIDSETDRATVRKMMANHTRQYGPVPKPVTK